MKLLLRLLFLLFIAFLISDVLGSLPRRYVPPPLRAAGDAPGTRTVLVRPGDTLFSIARRHGVTLAALRAANGLKSDAIQIGQRLRLPGK
jgi:LysM repeat protein